MSQNAALFNVFFYFVLLFIPLCSVNGAYIGMDIPDKLLTELYSSYKDALHIGEGTVLTRRIFTNSKQYQIHVMKLIEVNGNKRHNLLIKEANSTNPFIYINNPVETKIPNAYLTFEEFKKELTNRVIRTREDFYAKTNKKTSTAKNNLKNIIRERNTAKANKKNKTATANTKTKYKNTDEEAMLTLFLRNLDIVNKPSDKTEVSKAAEKQVYRAKTKLKAGTVSNKSNQHTKKLIAYTETPAAKIIYSKTVQPLSKEPSTGTPAAEINYSKTVQPLSKEPSTGTPAAKISDSKTDQPLSKEPSTGTPAAKISDSKTEQPLSKEPSAGALAAKTNYTKTDQPLSKESNEIIATESNTVTEKNAETALGSLNVTIVTENLIEPEVTTYKLTAEFEDESTTKTEATTLIDKYEPTNEFEVESTTTSEVTTTPVAVTETSKKWTKPSRPLVFMEE